MFECSMSIYYNLGEYNDKMRVFKNNLIEALHLVEPLQKLNFIEIIVLQKEKHLEK